LRRSDFLSFSRFDRNRRSDITLKDEGRLRQQAALIFENARLEDSVHSSILFRKQHRDAVTMRS
jgi:hypothetical protein